MKRIIELTEKLLRTLKPEDFDIRFADPNILVVEDDPVDAGMVKRALCLMGCTVDEARTGDEAIEKLARATRSGGQVYAMCFLDLKLPGATGIEVLAYIKLRRPSLPVVIVTGTIAHNHMLDEATQLGYFGLVKKPLQEENLTEIFAKHKIRFQRTGEAIRS